MQKSSIEYLSKIIRPNIRKHAEIIATRFSRTASDYEQFAEVQRFAANHLDNHIANNVNSPMPKKILEIGCGTGFLSRHLVSRFPDSKIDFIDPAATMLKLCKKNIKEHLHSNTNSKNHDFIEKSIEDHLDNNAASLEKYALIVSSFALHWISDLSSVLNRLIHKLEIGGQIFFSYPTNKSFPEWKSVCQQANLPFTGNQLPAARDLDFFLKANETIVTWAEYSYKSAYPNALEFFRGIKRVGADSTCPLLNPEPIFSTPQLSIKEFRQLLMAWNQQSLPQTSISPPNETTGIYNQTVDCTYWLVEGIITRHS